MATRKEIKRWQLRYMHQQLTISKQNQRLNSWQHLVILNVSTSTSNKMIVTDLFNNN